MAGRTGGTGRVPGIPLQKKGAVSLLRLSKSQRGIVVVSLTLGNGRVLSAHRAAEDQDISSNNSRTVFAHEHYQEVLYGKSQPLLLDWQNKADRASNLQAVLFPFFETTWAAKGKVPRDTAYICRKSH